MQLRFNLGVDALIKCKLCHPPSDSLNSITITVNNQTLWHGLHSKAAKPKFQGLNSRSQHLPKSLNDGEPQVSCHLTENKIKWTTWRQVKTKRLTEALKMCCNPITSASLQKRTGFSLPPSHLPLSPPLSHHTSSTIRRQPAATGNSHQTLNQLTSAFAFSSHQGWKKNALII